MAGVPIRLHVTFLLLIIWFGFESINSSGEGWRRLVLVVGLFVSVVLHELGHALMAARYGVRTTSITLYPIGGLARVADRPTPSQEVWIALAGPAVNLMIALALWLIVGLSHTPLLLPNQLGKVDALQWLLVVNFTLGLFNLVPAFPMDGGRILRASLALSGQTPVQATNRASQIGKLLAFGFGLYAILTPGGLNLAALFVAFFVYMGAGQEAQMVRQETAFAGVPLARVMVTKIETLTPGATLREMADRLLHTSQQDFPVMMGNEVVGLMTRERLLRGLSADGPDSYVAGAMLRDYHRALPDSQLSDLVADAATAGASMAASLPVLVIDQSGALVGIVTAENLAEFLAIEQILGAKRDSGRLQP